MKEILAGDGFDNAVKELNLEAMKTYSSKALTFEVWVISDKSFKKICAIQEEEWKDNWGYWRSADGTNLENEEKVEMTIGGTKIVAWYSQEKLEDEIDFEIEDNEEFDNDNKTRDEIKLSILNHKGFWSLREYLIEEWGASSAKNVCAITVGLAKINSISLSQLWSECQGETKC